MLRRALLLLSALRARRAFDTSLVPSGPFQCDPRGACGSPRVLQLSRVTVKWTPPLPPSEEPSTDWEDPSEGIEGVWKEEAQHDFAMAANSTEVKQAHFGPTWSRFATVGRLALTKMKENDKAGKDRTGSSKPTYSQTGEEMHAQELRTRRKIMENNYGTYEEYLAATLGGEDAKGEDSERVPVRAREASRKDDNAKVELYTAAAMERAFSVVDGADGLDRMVQRNLAREELVNIEAVEDAEAVPLPKFMLIDTDDPKALEAAKVNSFRPAVHKGYAGRRGIAQSEKKHDIPASFQAAVIATLPGAHSDPRIPTDDPVEWGTDAVLLFIELFEHHPDDDATTTRVAIDTDMINTFWMAKVDGKMLLNDITPPRLFRVMRRWHLQQFNIIHEAFRSHNAHITEAGDADRSTHQPHPNHTNRVELNERTREVIARFSHKLEEAVEPLDSEMIQETILMCFPYAR
ncbi:unnamed protein product [Phytomonas sp. Hart1]|nr:unnamed protein product [Phytomonas sp. Hart1]|eukprot:CCW71458.1 unnamed protein product [Phytomonas sp. isolate Hart1]